MSNVVKLIATTISGNEIETKWSDILDALDNVDGSAAPEKQTETEQEIRSRLLSKLNRREVA